MRLGTQTASLVNHIASIAVRGQPEPAVGMGATVLAWTDRHPGTIVDILHAKLGLIVTVREDHARRTDFNGMSESQTYEFMSNENGRTWSFLRTANGTWREVRRSAKINRWLMVDGSGLRIGERDKYHDFSF